MNTYTKYDEYDVQDVDDLQWYRTDISVPSAESLEFYERETKEAIRHVQEVFDVTIEGIRFVYGDWTDERSSELIDNRDTSYTSGYSFHPDFQSWTEEPTIYLKSSTTYGGWRDGFKNSVIHEIAHQLFYQGRFSGFENQIDSIVFEGHAMKTAKAVCEKFDYEYSSEWRPEEPITVPYEMVINELSKERTLTDEVDENVGNLFRGGEPFPNQEGYMISYQFGDWIDGRESYTVQDLPNLSSRKRDSLVRKFLQELYK